MYKPLLPGHSVCGSHISPSKPVWYEAHHLAQPLGKASSHLNPQHTCTSSKVTHDLLSFGIAATFGNARISVHFYQTSTYLCQQNLLDPILVVVGSCESTIVILHEYNDIESCHNLHKKKIDPLCQHNALTTYFAQNSASRIQQALHVHKQRKW